MNLYSLEEANFLIDYYSGLLMGKILEQFPWSTVNMVSKELFTDNNYRVMVYGTLIYGILRPKKSIDIVTVDLNLIAPHDVMALMRHSPFE